MRRRRLVSSDEATPAKGQHHAPCSDCPWARTALPGWLGSLTAAQWLAIVRSDARVECHVHTGAQCAGAATYRANTFKLPRDPDVLRLPRDRVRVFNDAREFTAHHGEEEDP